MIGFLKIACKLLVMLYIITEYWIQPVMMVHTHDVRVHKQRPYLE